MDTPTLSKSHKLDNVCYDIRGPVLEHAKRLEQGMLETLEQPCTLSALTTRQEMADAMPHVAQSK